MRDGAVVDDGLDLALFVAMHAIHCDSTTIGRLAFLAAIAATVLFASPRDEVADTETYIACKADVHDADTSPTACAVVGEEVQVGSELADLSTAAERQNVVIARFEFDAASLLEDEVALAAAKRTLELANARVESHIIRADRAGNIAIIHATRSNRAQDGYFSIVYYSRSR